MAMCRVCESEMKTADGCLPLKVPTMAGEMERILYGEELNNPVPMPGRTQHGVVLGDPPRCHDCGVLPGHFHHIDCDWEECPNCHDQLISCDCIVDQPEEVLQ